MAAVSSRYARALADVVTGPKPLAEPDAVERQLSDFYATVQGSADFRNLLESPAVQASKKKTLLDSLAPRMELSRVARNFLFLLVDHRRMGNLGEILTLFRAFVDEKQGLVQAQITSSHPLDGAAQSNLEAALIRKTGRKVRASYQVDPELIGGAVTRVGSTIYDGSVREQLRLLRAKLST
jgi:F-type H+-transporting ATPase subunit delta